MCTTIKSIIKDFSKYLYHFFKTFPNPVERHRSLYGHNGGWLTLSVTIIMLCIVFLWLLGLSLDGGNLLGETDCGRNEASEFWGIISQFADPGNIHMAKSGWASVIAVISAFAGVVCLSGLMVSSLINFINQRSDAWKKGLVLYNGYFGKKYLKNFAVIIGINEQAATIVKTTLQKGADYILIQTRQDVETARMKLKLQLEESEANSVIFYHGERTSKTDVENLRLKDAANIFILGEGMNDENEEDHDAFNMTCLELISDYFERLSSEVHSKSMSLKKKKCHVNFEYQSTYTIFKSTHIYKRINENIDFIPFNIHEIWAKKLLIDNYAIIPGNNPNESKVIRYLPLDCYRDEKTNEFVNIHPKQEIDKSVHFIIVGMNQMGVALAMQAALLIHLPNYHTKGLRTTISFIDENAQKEGNYLKGRFAALFSLCCHRTLICSEDGPMNYQPWNDPMEKGPYKHLGPNFMDVQWEFIEGNVASPGIQDYLINATKDENNTCTIAVCFNDPPKSIATALYLPESVLKKVLQVFVYQQNGFDLIDKVATGEKEWKRYEKLKPFGMKEGCYKRDMFDNLFAKLALCEYKSTLKYTNIDSFIDYLEHIWSEEGIVNKLSNINLADSFALKLRSAGLGGDATKDNINEILKDSSLREQLERAEHSRWLTERLTMGYRPLNATEHSYFYSQTTHQATLLPIDERQKLKEFYKSKNRAHLDICSYEMLKSVDDTLKNDRRIIRDLLKMTFYEVHDQVICRLAIRNHGPEKYNKVTTAFISQMKEIPECSTNNSSNTDNISMWMGAAPITQKLWKSIMGEDNNPSMHKGKDTDECPVEFVPKEDIDDFITLLNDKTGLRFRLPTKEEWFYAARGGLTNEELEIYCNNASDYAWFNEQTTQRVCQKKSNKYGLYDTVGNVWEWTQMNNDGSFCFCGGSWRFSKNECDLTNKKEAWSCSRTLDFKSPDLGFRLLLPHKFLKDETEVLEKMDEREKMLRDIVKHLYVIGGGHFRMGINQTYIPDGKFSSEGVQHYVQTQPDEGPEHLLSMTSFCISDAPVTQRQYEAFMGNNPSGHKGFENPVERVSYFDVNAFIKKINTFIREERGYCDGPLFDLPTEAQWEYAARCCFIKRIGAFPDYSGGYLPDDVAWHFGITKCTHPVRMKRSNAIHLYDMSGNVWEWCKDWYKADYYENFTEEHCNQNGKAYLQSDPEGPANGCTRVLRGGSWRSAPGDCRITKRSYWTEDYKADDVGFRLSLNVDAYNVLMEKLGYGKEGK